MDEVLVTVGMLIAITAIGIISASASSRAVHVKPAATEKQDV